ncbi:hypothetical protein CIB48_g1378 [Xylaria polymorpha]|nr:hypothetical protein CIB48_g1378 [Xylaria polymorpha]
MVLLTMTPSMVEALLVLGHSDNSSDAANDKARSNDIELEEPCMKDPAVGKPISHGQILKTIKALKANGHVGFRLETMLRGSSLYVPPPPPKPEPVRPIQPTRRVFGDSLMRDQTDEPSRKSDEEVDDIEFGDLQKQITLIINFLVSVFGCGAALWKLAQWWPVSTRLFLSLGGAIVVAITEVAVYSAYTWRMSQGEKQQAAMKEVREVVKTWVVGDEDEKTPLAVDDSHRFVEGSFADTKETGTKRTSSTESTEPPPKRRCVVDSSLASVRNEEARITPPEPEHSAAASSPKSPSLPPTKKGTITAYFGKLIHQPRVVAPSSDPPSNPLSESSGPTITPPSSPPIITKGKRRARRLKTRVVTQQIDEEEANEEEQENQDGKERIRRTREVESPAHARPPALSESTPENLNQTRSTPSSRIHVGKPRENRRREKKQASVQTTLSLSMNEAYYTECKECGMLYNHLHESDVKYHARRHAALRRAKAQAGVKSDVAE